MSQAVAACVARPPRSAAGSCTRQWRRAPSRTAAVHTTAADGPSWKSRPRGSCAPASPAPISIPPAIRRTVGRTTSRARTTTSRGAKSFSVRSAPRGQVMGNSFLMGLGPGNERSARRRPFPAGALCTSSSSPPAVSRSAWSRTTHPGGRGRGEEKKKKRTVSVRPSPVYVSQSLLPSLLDFWHQQVVPAFEERDQLGRERAPVGWVPSNAATTARKRRAPTVASSS